MELQENHFAIESEVATQHTTPPSTQTAAENPSSLDAGGNLMSLDLNDLPSEKETESRPCCYGCEPISPSTDLEQVQSQAAGTEQQQMQL